MQRIVKWLACRAHSFSSTFCDPASFLYLEIPETDPGGKQTVLAPLTSLELKS